MRKFLKAFRLMRSAGRPPLFDALFALAFVVCLGGLATLAYGVWVSDASAVPGLGIVFIVAGAYACSVFGFQDAADQQRSVPASLGNGFRQIWHWISPPK